MVVALATWTTVVAFATVAAGSAVATFATGTFATLATRSTLGFNVAFGLGSERTHRQAVFTGLFVDFNELDFYFVAFFEAACFHVGQAFPADFRYVKQAVAVGHEFDECTEFHYAAYGAGVCLAFFGKFDNAVDEFEGLVD